MEQQRSELEKIDDSFEGYNLKLTLRCIKFNACFEISKHNWTF